MTLEEVKQKMKEFTDIFGNRLLDHRRIDDCKDLFDCERIIEDHREHLKGTLSDAESNLDHFKYELGIN